MLTEPPRSGYSLISPFSSFKLITRHLLVVLGAAALMAGTIVGFVLARTVGIFGFHLTFSSTEAWTVLIVESAGVVMLLLTAALLWPGRQRR